MGKFIQISRRRAVTSIILIAVVTMVLGSWSYGNGAEPITIGVPISAPAYTPIYIARDQGFFARNDLDVTIREYEAGAAAMKGMLNDEVNIGGASEYTVVESALRKDGIKILGTIDENPTFYLTCRKDRGIARISDLKGKRIGVTFGGIGEFYLGRFLELHGMRIGDVKLVNIKMTSATEAIAGDKVDAVMVTQPNSYDAAKRLGAAGITWPAQNSQPVYVIMASKNDWIGRHPTPVVKFLNALAQAEDFILSHPTEARATLQKVGKYTDAFVAANWPGHQFSLSLNQSLVTAMEDEARWMIKNNRTSEKQVPDFQNYLYIDGLKKVKPEAVNIIR